MQSLPYAFWDYVHRCWRSQRRFYDRETSCINEGIFPACHEVGGATMAHIVMATLTHTCCFAGSVCDGIRLFDFQHRPVDCSRHSIKCRNIEKEPSRSLVLMFALPIFTARASYRHAVRKCPGDTCRHMLQSPNMKKEPSISLVLYVCVTYFHGQSPGNYRRRTCA